MDYVADTEPFSFDYPSPTLDGSVIVGAKIFDVSSGTAVLLAQVAMTHLIHGLYCGTYSAAVGKTYQIITGVFADAGGGSPDFSAPDAGYAPKTVEKQTAGLANAFIAWDYTDYGQSAALSVRAAIYETTSGTPVFVRNVVMAHVAMGAYLGTFTGAFGKTYQIEKAVYTDGTYATLDSQRQIGAESFVCLAVGQTLITNIFGGDDLDGQCVDTDLEALC